MDRPITPEVAAIIQAQINKGYHDFIAGVAQARKLPEAKVDSIARGRVWSGEEALKLGLVDHIGSLEEATDAAATLAKLAPGSYELEPMEPEHDFAQRLIARFSGSIRLDLLPGATHLAEVLARKPDLTHALSWLNDPRDMYAHCFCTPSMGGHHTR
jgi:protease-4